MFFEVIQSNTAINKNVGLTIMLNFFNYTSYGPLRRNTKKANRYMFKQIFKNDAVLKIRKKH